MHSFLSAVISFLLTPIIWIAALSLMGFFTKSVNKRKIFIGAALGLFLLLSNNWLLIRYARFWQQTNAIENKNTVYSSAILLGGFASPNEKEEGYFNVSADRFIQATRQYKLGKISHILIAGGNGKKDVANFNEGAWTKKELIIMGVPDSVIIFEDQSASTYDNAIMAKKLLDSFKLPPPYLLITSAHHMRRASLLFKQAGIKTDPLPCSYIAGNEKYLLKDILPRIDVLSTWGIYLKETAAYFIYIIKGK